MFLPGNKLGKGRPPGSLSIKNAMEAELRGKDKKQLHALARAVVQDAINAPDPQIRNKARTLVFEYIDGKVPDRIEGTLEHNYHAPLLEAFIAAGLSAGVRARDTEVLDAALLLPEGAELPLSD